MNEQNPEAVVDETRVSDDDRLNPDSDSAWRNRIARNKRVRDDMVEAWADNVEFRRGKPFDQESDVDRVNVNTDWALTKGKHAQLYSQTPQVYLTAKQDIYKAAIPKFSKQLNDTMTQAKVGTAMDEAVIDTINAAGFGVILTRYERTTESKDMPTQQPNELEAQGITPDQIPQLIASKQIPSQPVETTVDHKYSINRISPSDFIWQNEFTGSDFDESDFVGHSDHMSWPQAMREFGLTEDDKDQVLGSTGKTNNLRDDDDIDTKNSEPVVEFDELFYWAIRFDPEEKYFKKIKRIVFVKGKKEHVIKEDWKGQQFDDATGKYIGSCRFPLQVLTLTYISDDAIPPSDSAIGRPQVLELIESRTQIILQRKRSLPVRWYDVNRVDTLTQAALQSGEWQAFYPINGTGDKVIGEISRASYPPEDLTFDRMIKSDLQEQWQVSSNQVGSYESGSNSAAETKIVQQNFQTRIGYERARVASLLTRVAEVCGGLIALYGDFPILSQEDMAKMDQSWNRKAIGNELVYWVRADSTVLLDSNQRIDKLTKLLNLVGQSPFVNPQPLIEELISLHGVDPSTVMIEPEKKKESPNISYRYSGDDVTNPIVLAMLIDNNLGPTPEALTAALKVLEAAGMMPTQKVAGMDMPTSPKPPEPPMPPGGPGQPPPGGEIPANARPDWGPMPRVTKRPDEIGG